MNSMTGFGRGSVSGDNFEVSVEMKTVNNRFLDVVLKLGGELQALEAPLKKLISNRLTRGRVDVSIQYDRVQEISYELNRPIITGYLSALNQLKSDFDIGGDPDINVIARLPNIFTVKKEEASGEFSQAIETAVTAALADLELMRASEGSMLKTELLERLANIEGYTNEIEKEAGNIGEEYRQRLTKRIGELLSKTESQIELDQSRLAQEIAYLADRSDISEEIARLRTHIEHFRSIMDEEKEVGKRLDFLTQELNREANTITSKTNNMVVKENALQVKSEIEKIREQVQNVE
ncbi:MAG: YicC/YloC family endoribonuclease [Pyrinomonadaceae bacterium]